MIHVTEKFIQYLTQYGLLFCPLRPSTFAQAAKLKRLAVAKERELTKCEFTSSIKLFSLIHVLNLMIKNRLEIS